MSALVEKIRNCVREEYDGHIHAWIEKQRPRKVADWEVDEWCDGKINSMSNLELLELIEKVLP